MSDNQISTEQKTKPNMSFQLAPLSDEERSIFCNPNALGNPEFDAEWIATNLTGMSHTTSNEKGYHHFKDVLTPPSGSRASGLYVGLGAEQNYSLMACARPAFAILFDYDPAVIATHLIHRAAFLNSNSVDEFIKFYDGEKMEDSIEKIKQLYKNQPALSDRLVEMLKNEYIRTVFLARFRMMRAQFESVTGQFKDTFLNDEKSYQYIRHMYQHERVIVLMGNLYDPAFLKKIGALSTALHQDIIGFYASNAPDYQPEKFADVKQTLGSLPTNERSMLLTATHTYSAIRRIGGDWNQVGEDNWAYVTIPLRDLSNMSKSMFSEEQSVSQHYDLSPKKADWKPTPETVPVIPVEELKEKLSDARAKIAEQVNRIRNLGLSYSGPITVAQSKIESIGSRLDELTEKTKFTRNSKDHLELSIALKELELDMTRFKMMRPEKPEDMQYRKDLVKNFPRNVYNYFHKERGQTLYLHGQSSWLGRQTLLGSSLTSPIIRGLSLDTDVGPNYICISPSDHCEEALLYAGAKSDPYLPMGLVYVLLPSEEDEYQGQPATRNVDLHSDRLLRILVSPELLEQARSWAQEGGISPAKVTEYNAYLDEYKID